MKKGIFHIHSTFSYDGLNSINSIFRFVKKHNLDFVVLTDHDTIKGSLKLAEMVKQKGLKVEVPIAAEYKTERGDIIAVNIQSEIINMKWENFVKEVRLQKGLLILPHPYDGHSHVEDLAKEVDAIEVFNGRSSLINNFKSYLLSEKYCKVKLWGSDSHIPQSLKNVIIGFEDDSKTFIDSVLNNRIVPVCSNSSNFFDIHLSQIKKALVTRSFKLLVYVFWQIFFKK